MASTSNDTEFETISEQNYNKISQKLENIGYKEGVHDGRVSQFQTGFDIGYQNGIRNGFILGKQKGLLSAEPDACNSNVKFDVQNDLILQRPSRGQCILCTDKALIDNSISDIVELQTKHINQIQTTLKTRYEQTEP